MADQSTGSLTLIEWGVATLTLPGQTESGDRHLVKPFVNGVLVAVVDGLGHGDEAAVAAVAAVAALEGAAHDSVVSLVRRCHAALMRTRGVVVGLASFNGLADTMTWLGVGNIEGLLFPADTTRRRESLAPRGGVVGYQLPSLHPSVLPVTRGDMLIFATDGIQNSFAEGLLSGPPQHIAERILARHAKGTDDALVLVARYHGAGP